jgi:hypothetical protein
MLGTVGAENDGTVTVGEVPEAAIDKAKEDFGFENAILAPKAFV